MARFLLSSMPFTGHVAPVCAVATALIARGHEVRVYTGSAFERQVAASGARFLPWRAAPDFDENDLSKTFPRLVGTKGLGQLLINVVDVFIETSPAQVVDLQGEWDHEPWDVLAGDELSVGAALFAERTGVPQATIAVVPLNMSGRGGPPSGMGLAPGKTWLGRGRDAALRRAVPLLARPLRAPLARARADIGLTPSRRAFDEVVFSSRLVVASGSTELDYERPDRPPHVHWVGRLAPLSRGALPAWWDDLDGRIVIHVSQGTQNIDPSDLLRPAIEALADRDVRVVVATGIRGRDELPFPVPSNVRVAGYLPYAELLPRVDTMITNGGWGGTLAALSQGIPLVVAGGDLDKPETAARVAWSGAGVDLRTGRPSAAQIRRAVARVQSDPSIRHRATEIGERLRARGGPARAAELLEQLAAAA